MYAKYFIPYCIKPIFLHPNIEDAKKCGLINGFIYSALLTLLILIIGGRYYLIQENNEMKKKIMYSIVIGLILLWTVIPFISRFGAGTMWTGYQSSIDDLLRQGFTRQEAIAFLQGLIDDSSQLGITSGLTGMVFAKTIRDKQDISQPQDQNRSPQHKTDNTNYRRI